MEFKVGDIVKLRYIEMEFENVPQDFELYVVHILKREKLSKVVVRVPGEGIHFLYFFPEGLKKLGS